MRKLLSTVLLFFVCSSAFAYTCPSAEAIKSGGVYNPTRARDGSFFVINISQYDTNDQWVFAIGEITATTADDAQTKGTEALESLSGNPTVQVIKNIHVCEYNFNELGDSNLIAVAFLKADVQ